MNCEDDVCISVAADGCQPENSGATVGTEGRIAAHQPDGTQIRIVIVEDHVLFRTQLARLIAKNLSMTVCGEADNAVDALRVIEETEPDIAIVDITLKGSNGLELIKELKARGSKARALVLSMHDESMYAERALRAGASGYVTKHQTGSQLAEAIKRVLLGEIFLSGQMTARLLQALSTTGAERGGKQIAPLSPRETEVFQLLGQGLNNHDIAGRLQMGEQTVHHHRLRIKEKLGIKHNAELYCRAVRWFRDSGLS